MGDLIEDMEMGTGLPDDMPEAVSEPQGTDYIVSTDRKVIEKYQAEADAILGYPEDVDSLQHIGGGAHASKELGRATHYHPILEDQGGIRFALPRIEAIDDPENVTISEKTLPVDWTE